MKIRLKHERLAQEMAKRPVTLNRWAQRLGLRSGHLSQLTNGKRPYPTARTRRKLLEGLGIDFEELFDLEVPPQERDTASRARFSEAGATQPRRRHRRYGRETSMSGWLFDLRSAFRSLARRPGFALAAILTIAIGIGANVALFTGVNAALFKAYPYDEPDRLFQAFSTTQSRQQSNLSWPDSVDLRERLQGVLDLAVWDWEPFSLAGGDRPQRLGGAQVTSNYAEVIGVEMLKGRFFTDEEERSGASVLVIGEALWRGTFGSDPAIVGREVLLNGRSAIVVGVAPRSLNAIDDASLFVPLAPVADSIPRFAHWLGGFARLAPGVPYERARERLEAVAAQLAAEYPDSNEGTGAGLLSLREARVGPVRTMFLTLLGVVIIVLLIVSANVANLLLSRGTSRQEELSLRAALGAGRGRLARLLLLESAWIALAGLSLGVLLGFLGARGLIGMLPTEHVPAWLDPSPDATVALYAIVATLVTMGLATLIPAARLSRTSSAITHGGRSRMVGGRMRSGLVVAEVALSCILLLGAGLMIRSLLKLTGNNPGFESRGALLVGLDLLSMRNEPSEAREQRFLEYYHRLAAIPSVEAVGAINRIPMGGGANNTVVTAQDPTGEDPFVPALHSRVTAGYFDAMRLALLEGRDFELEPPENAPPTVVVSRSLAEKFWPGESPLGKRVRFGRPEDNEPWLAVRGVVGEVRHYGLAQEPRPTIYVTDGAVGMTRAQWVLRARTDPESLTREVRTAVAEIDSNQPLWGVRSLEDHVAANAWQERFFATLFWGFAGLALVLSAIGLYGVLAYGVAQRRREMGLRVALGASTGRVARQVVAEGMKLVAVGLLVGLPAALVAGRFLSKVLYGVAPYDTVVLFLVVVVLAGVGLLAVALPARRVSRLDPADMLRLDG